MSVKRLQHNKRIVKTLASGLVLSAALSLAGCEMIDFPLTVAQAPVSAPGTVNPSQAGPASNSSVPGTRPSDAGNVPAPSGTQPGSVPGAPVSSTGEEALAAYEEARLALRSETMTHLWSVESEYPLKTGEIVKEANFSEDGRIRTAKGTSIERVGNDEKKTAWYQTEDEYAIKENGSVLRFPLSAVKAESAYDIPGLAGKILSEYSVSLESGTWFVKLTTQNEREIQSLMESLGYRKSGEGAYAGSLYLEAMVEEKTGHLRMVNYIFRHRHLGYTDNGSVTFTGQGKKVDVTIPEDPPMPDTAPDNGTPANP